MKNHIFARLMPALLVVPLALTALAPCSAGAESRSSRPKAEAFPSAPADGAEREVRRKPALAYHEYVRLVSGRRMSAKHAAKGRAKVAPKAAAPTKVVAAAPPAPAPPVVAAAPAVPAPRRPGVAWRPGIGEVREILRTSRDLRGAVLQRMDLAGVDLRGADLAGADLFGANLDRALLDGANLRGTSLEMASLRGASLRGAKLAGAGLFMANLEGADLAGADLTGVYAVSANLRGASLASAVIRGGAFTNAALGGGQTDAASGVAMFPFRHDAGVRVVAAGEGDDAQRPAFGEGVTLVTF